MLELARKMETDAIAFYSEAAQKSPHPVGKKMFLAVAEDEKHHLEMLDRLIKGLDISPRDVRPLKNVKTIFEAMKEEMTRRAAATTDELEAFQIAMRMEKEGLNFYQKTLDGAKKDKERVLLARLIEEEREHYLLFANTHELLADTGNWFMWEERGIVEGG